MPNETPTQSKKLFITAGLAAALIVCLCAAGLLFGGLSLYQAIQPATPTEAVAISPPETPARTLAAPTPMPTATPSAQSTRSPTPTTAPKVEGDPLPLPDETPAATGVDWLYTDMPMRDLRALTSRLQQGGAELPAVVNATPPSFSVGDTATFWVSDDTGDAPRQFQSTASLRYITDHTHWWVEDGFRVDAEALKRSATVFESQTYPTNREFFGSEWTPGVDNDPHLSIFLGNVPGVAGYYASLNEYSQEVNPYSNEREMFFINLSAIRPGGDAFDGVLAHEFQHMIHWHQDRNEATWVNEGLSELASHLNGYDAGNARFQYLAQPDLQLNAWGETPSQSIPHYGNSYLFMAYFLERFGEETLKAVVANPANDILGFEQVLRQNDSGLSFDDVFADFVIANYLNDPALADGRWGYTDVSMRQPQIDRKIKALPVTIDSTVHQYGVDYLYVEADGPFDIEFSGETNTQVVDNQAYSGAYHWYSNRGDDSDATLTRPVDLRNVDRATLNYRVWYDIETDWDYAYLAVSTDDGVSWQIVPTAHTVDTNPSGNAYGPGYTGRSDGWLLEEVDLSAFAGQEILLRFEYITDDAINAPGLTLDDVAIPEIGFFDDMESPDPAWQADGFVRIDNVLPQAYTVQVITLSDVPHVSRLLLDEGNAGQTTVPALPGQAVVVAISAQAPLTTQIAPYSLRLSPAE